MSNAMINSVEINTVTNESGSSALTATIHTADGSDTYQAATAFGTTVTQEEAQQLQEKITNSLTGINATHQQEVDDILTQVGESTDNDLDTDAVLSAVSIATAKTAASVTNTPLFEHIKSIAQTNGGSTVPRLYASLIAGGTRTTSPLTFQSFHVIPETDDAERAQKVVRDIKTALGTVLRTKTHESDMPTAHNGSYSPHTLEFNQGALELLMEGVAEAFPEVKIKLAIDAGARQLYKNDHYHLDQQDLSVQQLHGYYDYLIDRFHISSIEDPFYPDSFSDFRGLKERHDNLEVVGGELIKNDINKLHQAHEEKSITAVSVIPSDSRTLSEMLTFIRTAHESSLHCIISHGHNETPESFISDLAVGCGCHGIRAGAPGTTTNDAKYQRLIEIASL